MVANIKQSITFIVAIAAFFGILIVFPSTAEAWHCVDMSASPETIELGDSSTLNWEFFEGPDDDPDTITVTIDNIPETEWAGLVGSTSVSPAETTTYTARATKIDTSEYFECSATVKVLPPEEPKVPACPYKPSDNLTVIDFNGGKSKNSATTLFSNGAGPHEIVSSTVLAVGKYTVYTASWDGYVNRVGSEQFNETWDTEVRSSGGVLASVGPTTDLEDFVIEDMKKDTFSDAFTLSEDGAEVAAVHHVYPDNSSPNSVVPVCVAFEKEEVEEPWCELNVNPNSILEGGEVTIDWDSYLVSTVDITEIGTSLSMTGSSVASPATTTTYIGTFYPTDGSDPLICEGAVTVRPPTDDPELECTMTATPTYDNSGYTSVITWTSNEATSAVIDNGIGDVSLDGNTSVVVNSNTTYTGTFSDDDGNSVTCSVNLRIKTGGGGDCINCHDDDDDPDDPEPTIILGKTISKSGGYITLDQVPYTGFEAGPLLTVTFWFAVFALSVFIAYLATRLQVAEKIRMSFSSIAPTEIRNNAFEVAPVAPVTNVSATASTQSNHEPSEIEEMSHNENILLSPEALRLIQEVLVASKQDVSIFMAILIDKAKADFPREDGWILLSKERVEKILPSSTQGKTKISVENTQAVAEVAIDSAHKEENDTRPFRVEPKTLKETNSHRAVEEADQQAMPRPETAPVASPEAPAPKKNNNVSPSQNLVSAFLEYLVTVKKKEAFDLMRSITTRGVDVAAFVTLVVRELDEVYKERIEGNRAPNEDLVHKTASWTNEDFEKVLGILVECIDYSYSNNRIGTKIALAKAFEHFDSKK